MKSLAVAVAAGSGVLAVSVISVASAVWSLGSLPAISGSSPSANAVRSVPTDMIDLYQRASSACPGLAWTVLAGVGTVESDNGQSAAPGVRGGANRAGAEGPMQFEPATFARYDHPIPPGGADPPSPYDPADAVYAAARYLCSLGAPGDIVGSLIAYNCGNTGPACRSASSGYARRVITLADSYGQPAGSSASAALAVAAAETQIGVPYRWGGETPGGAFDCSGLVQWAFSQAGVGLPRTAQSQFDAGPHVSAGSPLEPGDLVFFGTGPWAVQHVGLVVGGDVMIDAPHQGAAVRFETFPGKPGESWGSEMYVGATRPA